MVSTHSKGHGSINHATNLILLIEDEIDHAELIIRRTKENLIPNQVLHFHDGNSALGYLFRRNHFSDPDSSPRPQIVLLDIHLPGADGIDILRTMKASDELKMIPVIMLTTSAAERDITRAYWNHANSYLVKPVGCAEFKELMDNLCTYWLGNNMNPRV
jgi:DNA-binding response OmpR family regulator